MIELKTILIIIVASIFFAIAVWIFHDKSEKAVFMPLRLFPRWVKYLGLTWAILSFVLPVVFFSVLKDDFMFDGKNYIGVMSGNLGLLLICFSKDKIEDEMTNMIRLKSFYRSGILGFSIIVIFDIVEILLGGTPLTESFSFISMVLFLYLIMFYSTKLKVRS